jgi:hypothetical protein
MPWWILVPILILGAFAIALSLFASSSAFDRAWEVKGTWHNTEPAEIGTAAHELLEDYNTQTARPESD